MLVSKRKGMVSLVDTDDHIHGSYIFMCAPLGHIFQPKESSPRSQVKAKYIGNKNVKHLHRPNPASLFYTPWN